MIFSSRGIQTLDVIRIRIRIDKTELRWFIIISFLVKHYDAIAQICEEKEREILQKTEKEKDATEVEQLKANKEREEEIYTCRKEYKFQDQASKIKTKDQRQEEKELKKWEMMPRFKKDEFDKRNNSEENKRQWQQKLVYRRELQKDIVRIYLFNITFLVLINNTRN